MARPVIARLRGSGNLPSVPSMSIAQLLAHLEAHLQGRRASSRTAI